ncbi:hypothetical protein [Cellulomonas sp. P24]|jgi:hypothetical protein|uniref:hypothetical protein n=1 Tax=Cellulomonas sp. P24 TaxID=2885206 RepID=UPI00216B3F0D|nr:hypothetical protein [Cellulomonas sp. P24]MCR6491126.1 hypothetical protein [Cellulomonas sp. P24]
MTPKKLRTREAGRGEARSRRLVAEKYLEVADLASGEDGATINVTVGIAVLAGIAAGDAICMTATGEYYSGPDHAAAAELLARIDAELGKRLSELVALKPAAHYGYKILDGNDRTRALRHATALVTQARARTA